MSNKTNEVKLGVRVLKGAAIGALSGPVAVVVLVGGVLVFESSFWSLESLRVGLAVLVASGVGGALIGAFAGVVTPDRPRIIMAFLPVGGAVAGVVFLLILGLDGSLVEAALTGAVIVVLMLLIAMIEGAFGHKDEEKITEPVTVPYGPEQECPRCQQMTRNPYFCEVCGKDIRLNPPALVLPD